MEDLTKEVQSLKSKISELETKLKNNDSNFKAFGRSYSKIGSSDSDFLIKTKGQVKIQWGSKFIDLIKDGKINVDSKFIYKENQVGVKDGIYVIEDGEDSKVILKVGDNQISLVGEVGNTYVSFQGEQQTTQEQKYTALTNIGFLYKDLKDIGTDSLQNGIIYVESEQKLYIVQEGQLAEFNVELPNPYTKQFIIQKQDNSKGSLLIVGSGIENSIAFDSLYLYTEGTNTYLKSSGNICLKVGEDEKVVVGKNETLFNNIVTSQTFRSKDATDSFGFRLYFENNQSTLEVDNLKVRNQQGAESSSKLLYPIYWHYKNNVIIYAGNYTSQGDSGESQDEEPSVTGFNLTLAYKNEFEVGQNVYVYLPIENETIGFYNQLLLPLIIDSVSFDEEEGNTIRVSIIKELVDNTLLDSIDLEDALIQLRGQTIFLISQNEQTSTLIRDKENNIDLIEVENLQQALENNGIIARVGNIEELQLYGKESGQETPIQGYGSYSKNSAFLKAQYTKDYELSSEDNSTKFVSTEWIHKLFPKNSIIMFNGTSNIPNGWTICDGTSGTPNLTDKFIQDSSSAGSENYSVIYIMKTI